MSTPFWFNNPSILFNRDTITKIYPEKIMTSNEKLNAITRLVILFTILGYLITEKYKIILTGIITLAAIVFLHFIQRNKESKNEGAGWAIAVYIYLVISILTSIFRTIKSFG